MEDSQIAGCLKEASISVARVRFEVEKFRQCKKVDNFRALLKTYGRDLLEQTGKLDPVMGRDEEIWQVNSILSSMTMNDNSVLIGEPGVSKTAVVQGLAHRIIKGDMPNNLLDIRLIALDMETLHTGTHLEERM